MFLYNLDKGDFFTVDKSNDDIYEFEKIDGMYSICRFINGGTVHFSANMIVHKVRKADESQI